MHHLLCHPHHVDCYRRWSFKVSLLETVIKYEGRTSYGCLVVTLIKYTVAFHMNLKENILHVVCMCMVTAVGLQSSVVAITVKNSCDEMTEVPRRSSLD